MLSSPTPENALLIRRVFELLPVGDVGRNQPLPHGRGV
jgi:hypothetical protein